MSGSSRPTLAWGLLAVAIVGGGFIALRAHHSPELPVYWHAPEFALVDQDGDTLRSSDLAGTVWVASFVFTHCTDVCPRITREMAHLRDSLRGDRLLGQQVRLLSFSVDPARDSPGVLREYADKYGGSPASEWAFLTGDPPEMVQRMIEQGFHLAATPLPAGPEDTIAGYQVMHSVRVELVDRTGQVRGTYQATDPEAMERLATDLRRLLE